MSPDDPHSYRRWMHETFFNHVNIPPQNIHIPDGTIAAQDVEDYCCALRAEDSPGRRHRPADPRHRPHRAHRLQRARFHAPQPHAPGHARPGDAPRRGQRFLRRGERAAPGAHDGRRHHPRGPQDRHHGLRRAQGPHRAAGRRRGHDRRRRPPASCRSTPTRPSCSTRPPPAQLTPVRRPWVVGR